VAGCTELDEGVISDRGSSRRAVGQLERDRGNAGNSRKEWVEESFLSTKLPCPSQFMSALTLTAPSLWMSSTSRYTRGAHSGCESWQTALAYVAGDWGATLVCVVRGRGTALACAVGGPGMMLARVVEDRGTAIVYTAGGQEMSRIKIVRQGDSVIRRLGPWRPAIAAQF
jgi:hypothetical protein